MDDLQNRCLYDAGENIVEEGHPGTHICIIEKGAVEVWKKDSEGKKIVLGYLSTGQIFGEMAIIHQATRSATVTSLEPTVIININGDRLLEALSHAPPVVTTLIRTLVANLRNAQS